MSTKKKPAVLNEYDAPEKINPEMFYGLKLDEHQLDFANAIWNPNIDIVWCNSTAGTGKTTIAVGVANLLVKYGRFNNIIYIMAPYGERKQGYMPGSLTEKSSVYFEALYQALITCNEQPSVVINTDSMVNQKNGTGFVTCITDTFIRGTTFDDAVVIIDEAQNCTLQQLKKILTRVKDNTKVVVIGHNLQCDIEGGDASGFLRYIDYFQNCERSYSCELTNNYRGWISRHADSL